MNRNYRRWSPLGDSGAIMAIAACCGMLIQPAMAGQAMPDNKPVVRAARPTRYQPAKISRHALAYYGAVWGINALSVKAAESGELIRFTYQVLDPEKAKSLNDKMNTPFLVAPDAGVRLSIPTLEKVGQLRQSSSPEPGKSYWMAFSNPGRKVKPGDRVDVVIGQFRAEDLIVE